MKRYLKLLGLFCAACFGLSGISVGIGTLLSSGGFSQWFIAIAAFAFSFCLIKLFVDGVRKVWDDWKAETNESSYIDALKSKTGKLTRNLLFSASAVGEDLNEQEKLISRFREDYLKFFSEEKYQHQENSSLQGTATQIFWNILSLQKHRLDRSGLTMKLDAQRMRYLNNADSVTGRVLFDGKYEVSEVFEMIRADRTFSRDRKKIARFRSKEAARYHLLNARRTGEDRIICPNCGNISSRENLIDGCDFCHTRFLVEDLGLRISDFGLFSDYDIEYKKYTEARTRFLLRISVITAPIMMVYTILNTLPQVFTSPSFGDHGMLFELGAFLCFITLRAAFLTAAAVGAVLLLASPVLSTQASVIRYRRSDLRKMRTAEQRNEIAQKQIRQNDPMFSLGEFFANIQNKLAVFHYAENARQMEAFTEGEAILTELPSIQEQYQNIVHFDVKQMVLEQENHDSLSHTITVSAQLVLLEQRDRNIRKRKETVRLKLKRSSSCQTNSVCAPAVMTCKNCGAPHHILDGRVCPYCGHTRVLSDYDWAIEAYEPFTR